MAIKPETERYAVGCIVFALVIFAIGLINLKNPSPGHGKEQKPPENQSSSKQADSTADNAAPLPLPHVLDITSPNSKERSANGGQDQNDEPFEYWWLKSRWVTIWVAGVMIAIGIAQFTMYLFQWRIMKATLKTTARAYITIETNGKPNLYRNPDTFSIYLRNTGQTPAYNVLCHITWEFFPEYNILWPQTKRFKTVEEIRDLIEDEGSSTGTLGADQTWTFDCPMTPNDAGLTFDEARTKAVRKAGTVFVYGEIHYETFGEARKTEFCMASFFQENTDRGVPGITFTNYGAHNHAT